MKKLGKGFSPYARIDNNGEYFCAKCGKAGFTERKKINGHIGGCNGTKDLLEELGSSGGTTTTTNPTTTTIRKVASEMAGAGAGLAVVDLAFGSSSPVQNQFVNLELLNLKEDLELIKKTTTNHISHLSGMSGGFGDFFSNPKVQLAILVVGVIAIFYILEKGDNKAKTSMGGKILDFAMKKL